MPTITKITTQTKMIPDPTDKATDGMLPAPACSPSSTPFIDAYLVATLCKYGTLDEYTAPKDWVMVARKLERERDEALKSAEHAQAYKRVMKVDNQKLKQELAAAMSVISTIEEIYMDGCDTYEDWMAMGKLARAALSEENATAMASADSGLTQSQELK